MAHYHSLDESHFRNTWLTIGVFDGVHRGHQELIHQLVSGAHADGSPAVVLTFHPHPAVVLGGRTDFKCLTTADERAALLEALGVEAVITLTFDPVLAGQTAEVFMQSLSRSLGLRALLIGYDTALGHGREGEAHRLARIGEELGYRLQVVPPVLAGGEIISSTRIRARLVVGDVAAAADLLGRPYALQGRVVHGDGRGRSIGIPTANLAVQPGRLIPGSGVYACQAWLGGKRYAAVTNIGIRPTFTPEKTIPNVETHLLDFSGEVYGQEIRLEFMARLREERKFPDVQALITQVRVDIELAARLLS